MMMRLFVFVLALLPTVALPGCAAAIPAVSALSAGAAAGEKGYSFWRSGRLYYVDEGTLEEMTQAIRSMIERLALTTREETDHSSGDEIQVRQWTLRTDRSHLLRLEIIPLTPALIAVELDTGAFGNNAAAQLVAQRIKEELDAVQQRPQQPETTGSIDGNP